MVQTCPAAMGFAFAAGTTDGPGAFDFEQGDDKVMMILVGSFYDMDAFIQSYKLFYHPFIPQ